MTLEDLTLSENPTRFSENSRVITEPEEIKKYLEMRVVNPSDNPHALLFNKLKEGDCIANGNIRYIINDIEEICKYVAGNVELQPGKVPLQKVYESFRINSCEYGKIIDEIKKSLSEYSLPNNSRVIQAPFLEALKKGIGACFEHGVLTLAFAQSGEPAFCVQGYINSGKSYDSPIFCDPHTFNILGRDGELYLADTQNPSGNPSEMASYVDKILGIKPSGEIITEKGPERKLRYCLGC